MDTEMNRNDKQIDDILSEASPRAIPNSRRKEEIYGELRSEWFASNHQVKRRRQYWVSGIAASLAAALIVVTQLDTDVMAPDAVLARTSGAQTTLNGRPIEEVLPVNAPLRFKSGDVIVTGIGAAVSINWSRTGSLRMGAESEVVLLSNEGIRLRSGEIYYDSRSFNSNEESPIEIVTPFGMIHHVGTQFLAIVDDVGMRISVREGQVTFGDATRSALIRAGESGYIDQTLTATISPVSPSDPSWSWATKVSPGWNVDGRSTMEIIHWLARETGLRIEFESERASKYAIDDRLRGIGEIEPIRAMSIVPIATELRFDIDDTSIRIGMKDQ
jgi:hypothetical protein